MPCDPHTSSACSRTLLRALLKLTAKLTVKPLLKHSAPRRHIPPATFRRRPESQVLRCKKPPSSTVSVLQLAAAAVPAQSPDSGNSDSSLDTGPPLLSRISSCQFRMSQQKHATHYARPALCLCIITGIEVEVSTVPILPEQDVHE